MTWRPEREIEIVAGTPPGGGLDRSARALAKSIVANRLLDVPVKVVNVGGDGGRKAWAHMDRYAGDGHVIGISSPNMAADYLTGVTTSDPDRFSPLAILYSEGVAKGRLSIERLVDLIATTPARLFGLERKGAIEIGKDADLVLFDPAPRRTLRATDLHHTSDYTPYEGFELEGAVRSVFVRGRPVVRDGRFVGRRGAGEFVARSSAGADGSGAEHAT